MSISHHFLLLFWSLACIMRYTMSQTRSVLCNGNIESEIEYCVCYESKSECRRAITNQNRSDCFWHNIHGCISITNSPTTEPTISVSEATSNATPNPTQTPSITRTTILRATLSPTVTTPSPTHHLISILKCSDEILGETADLYEINWYGLIIETTTDLLIDSCGSDYDTWLYFEKNNGISIGMIDCDDCGSCSLQTQLHITNVHKGNYTIGVGGYRAHYGKYILKIICSVLPPNMPFILKHPNTTNPTSDPTHFPTNTPTNDPTVNPTHEPTHEPTTNTSHLTIITTSNPTIEPTFYPTLFPTPIPTSKPTNLPTKRPSVGPTLHPTITPTALSSVPTFISVASTYQSNIIDEERLLSVDTDTNAINSFEIALIFAVLLVFMIICVIFALKHVKRRREHVNLALDIQDTTDYSEDEDEDFMKYLHGKTNSIDIDEIIERAKTNLLNVTVDENSPYVE